MSFREAFASLAAVLRLWALWWTVSMIATRLVPLLWRRTRRIGFWGLAA